jgi:hypothetical protein
LMKVFTATRNMHLDVYGYHEGKLPNRRAGLLMAVYEAAKDLAYEKCRFESSVGEMPSNPDISFTGEQKDEMVAISTPEPPFRPDMSSVLPSPEFF